MRKIIYFLFFIMLSFSFQFCNDSTDKENSKNIDFSKTSEPLVKANNYLKRTEENEINGYIERHKWEMQKTNTGVRYFIYKKGKGERALPGKIIKINYTLDLIDGTNCYSSEKDGPKIFKIGEGKVEAGLDEAMQLLCKGDKAKIIIPSYLGFGLLGDNKKIPKRATLIYDVELVDMK
ncbi:MAG: FKBP-type peptidyl-prolyl cis-trans isomerase [Bacteroidales bacterium]|nr:FKBP-type peptidyl-prolyl cis-trans isomerase [Bacteroidales bacterium]